MDGGCVSFYRGVYATPGIIFYGYIRKSEIIPRLLQPARYSLLMDAIHSLGSMGVRRGMDDVDR